MTDISLNPALASKLEALRNAWGQDSVTETISTIFDSAMNSWQIPLPQMTTIEVQKSIKVRLRPRHDARLAALASESGLNVAELARMMLVQFLFGGQMAISMPLPPQITTKSASTKTNLAITKSKKPKTTSKKAISATVEAISTPETPFNLPTMPSKPKGRQLFDNL